MTELSATLCIRPVPVTVVSGVSSPVVWGLGHPRLLWPALLPVDASGACLDGVLMHELAHVKRRDHLVGWLELAAGVMWWWNPLFWYVRSALREQAELACDAWVISTLPHGRRAYAESLLALSGAAALTPPSMAVSGIHATSRRVLERRLVMIMKGRPPLRVPVVGLCCLALVAVATLPAWAASQQPPPPPPPPAPVAAQAPLPAPPPPPPPPVPFRLHAESVQQNPTPPRRPVQVVVPRGLSVVRRPATANLPAEGQALLEDLERDQQAIRAEADEKIAARRAAATKALEDLQDQMTKAGKLDEAIAIRDFLRAGGLLRIDGETRSVLRRER